MPKYINFVFLYINAQSYPCRRKYITFLFRIFAYLCGKSKLAAKAEQEATVIYRIRKIHGSHKSKEA